MFYTKQEGIDFIYESYLKAQPYLNYDDPDSKKRNPNLTKQLLEDLAFGTNILVTGSKGKGSVAHMLSLVLQSQGKKTGLFTSPHITDFCERIRVDEKMILDEKFLEYANKIEGQVRSINTKPGEYVSPIGITLALAFYYFRENHTSVHVLECGKGARYDDTKNVWHDYGAVTPIFLEHTRELGKTLEEIAWDKSHIIEPGQKCVFLAGQQGAVLDVLLSRAEKCGVEAQKFGKDFSCENVVFTDKGMQFDVLTRKNRYTNLGIPLLGTHQAENCAMALALGEEICDTLDEQQVKSFLLKLNYPGRMEVIGQNPFTLLNACINRQEVPMLKEVAERIPHKKLAAILAVPEDKDYLGAALAIKDIADIIVFTSTDNPHYHFSRQQAKVAGEMIPGVCYIERAKEAYDYVKKQDPDFICILGTTSLITEFKR